jgi:hypothetical protein
VSVSANDKQTMSPASSPTEGSGRPSNGLPQGKSSMPTQSTNDPTQYLSTEKPTNAYYASTEDIIETIVSTTAPTETKPTSSPTKRIPGDISEKPSSDLSRATGEPSFAHSDISTSDTKRGTSLPSQAQTTITTINETATSISLSSNSSLPNRSFSDDNIRYYDLSQWYVNKGGSMMTIMWKNHALLTLLMVMLMTQ